MYFTNQKFKPFPPPPLTYMSCGARPLAPPLSHLYPPLHNKEGKKLILTKILKTHRICHYLHYFESIHNFYTAFQLRTNC